MPRKDGRPRSLPGSEMLFLPPNSSPDMVWRQRKGEAPLEIPRGEILVQEGPPRSGKTVRANAWMDKDPENRRVVDGVDKNDKEAKRLANEGYSVVLNICT